MIKWLAALALLCVTAIVGSALAWRWFGNTSPTLEPAEIFIPYVPPRGYVCYRASAPITMDGKLDDPAWPAAPWSEDFVDIEGDKRPRPRFRTRVKMLWDDEYFYIAAELEEPHLQASFTRHDSYIFHEDNDFEVFIDPDGTNHNYVELEINALNTTWDLLLGKPYHAGGPPDDSYEINGLKTAVHVDGTLNDPRDVDRGWTIELALPWATLSKLSRRSAPPQDGDQWRVNFSRVQWRFDVVDGQYRRLRDNREDNWVWSPQWVINMHRPETWGYVQFSTAAPGKAVFRPDPAGPGKHLLHQIYYAQSKFRMQHGRYASRLSELGLAELSDDSLAGPPRMTVQDGSFQATVDVRRPEGGSQRYRIRQDALILPVGPQD
jgi:hypothetical protein